MGEKHEKRWRKAPEVTFQVQILMFTVITFYLEITMNRCTEAGFTSKLVFLRFPWLKHLEIKVMRRGCWLQHYNIRSHSKLMFQCFNQHEDQFHNWGHTKSIFFISCFPLKLLMFASLENQRVIPVTLFLISSLPGRPKNCSSSAIIKDVAVCLFLFGGVRRLPGGNVREEARDQTSRKSFTRLTLYWRSVSDWRLQLITLIWFYTGTTNTHIREELWSGLIEKMLIIISHVYLLLYKPQYFSNLNQSFFLFWTPEWNLGLWCDSRVTPQPFFTNHICQSMQSFIHWNNTLHQNLSKPVITIPTNHIFKSDLVA